MIPKPTKRKKKKQGYIKTNKQPPRNPSIMTNYEYEEGKVPHEIYFGRKNRLISFRLGLWVWVWPWQHDLIHSNGEVDKALKREGQRRFEELFSREEFMKEIGFNYLWEED